MQRGSKVECLLGEDFCQEEPALWTWVCMNVGDYLVCALYHGDHNTLYQG